MKGMKYNNRLLRDIEKEFEITGRKGIRLKLASIQETNNLNDDDIAFIAGEDRGERFDSIKKFIEQFEDAKVFGSLIKIENFDCEFLEKKYNFIKNNPAGNIEKEISKNKVEELLADLIKQSQIMSEQYDVLVTNPPYIGNKYFNDLLNDFLNKSYQDVKYDLFSAFIEYSFSKVKGTGHLGFMTPFVWMFISSYEKLRKMIIENKRISSLIQLEYSGFEEATVPVCTFTLRNDYIDISGEFIKLSNFRGAKNQPIKVLEAVMKPEVEYRYSTKTSHLHNIPGNVIAYWISEPIWKNYIKYRKIQEFAEYSGAQNKTADNEMYLRKHWEVNYNKIGEEWIKIAKGGFFRRWYGNIEELINWSDEAKQFYKNNKTSCIMPDKYLFREAITWTKITSIDTPSFRIIDKTTLYETAAPSLHFNENLNYFLALLNSIVGETFIQVTKQTLNFQVFDIVNVPVCVNQDEINNISKIVNELISISKLEWDSFETSLEFKVHPLLTYKQNCKTIKEAYTNWERKSQEWLYRLKEREEEINKIFISIYGLEEELNFDVAEKKITLSKADEEREIKSFISYVVGCILGRYSLDQEGLVYAGGEFNYSKYKIFEADEDNIIPILSGNYFEEDIISKFVEFVKVTFGGETLSENIEYIAEKLGKKSNETAKDAIRRYFLSNFYKDHIKIYKNRPIYWMFTSGKQKAFNCLIYMHRYDKTTLSRIRTDYLHELQDRLDNEKKALVDVTEGDYSTKEKSEVKKKLTSLDKQIDELKKYDEVLHHMADMQIEIDLDDGVKINYQKFKGLLAKI